MRSKAHIKTHPLHPILVAFPIAFFTGALVFDVLAQTIDNEDFSLIAYYLLLAGVITALIAAVPGFIDFLFTVPPASSARKRAATHGILNLCMVALFTTALFLHPGPGGKSGLLNVILEAGGFVLMLFAGWMGGTLVHRNQIGVDPRYAFAGKWRERSLVEENGKVKLGDLSDLKRDQMMLVHVSGQRIVVARTENSLVAFDDRCTHKGGSLAGGMMICGTVQCPWHGSQFDVNNGAVKAGPADEKIAVYPITQERDGPYLHLRKR